MNISLPKKFRFQEDGFEAYIDSNNNLVMTRTGFEKIMYALTYAMKGDKVCHYCGNPFGDFDRSLDHQYSRDFGGISIPNNLVPCCRDCNERKSNMNAQEFYEYELIKSDPIKVEQFMEDLYRKRDEFRKTFGVILPFEWYSLKSDYNVLAPITSQDAYKSNKQYTRISDLYETYHRICRPVVVTKNDVVVDGFLALMFAKNNGQKDEIPFIRLDNVIAI